MKIGVVTFWQGNDNYGMILQCWALQTYLKKLGHDPYVIRYNPIGCLPKRWLKSIIKKVKCLLSPSYRHSVHQEDLLIKEKEYHYPERKFEEFRNQYLTFSKLEYHYIEKLRLFPPKADCYICGSDQIWKGPLWSSNTKGYFLDFGHNNTKRVAYAPSFGMDKYPKEQIVSLGVALSKLDFISCREMDGVNFCKEAGYSALHVVDPTLLLEANDYDMICATTEKQSKNLFIYSLNIESPNDIFFEDLCDIYDNCSILVTPASGFIPGREIFGKNVKYTYPTPSEWISQVRNADLVVTSSFHGIVLSIIHRTKFAFVPLTGGHSSSNNRVVELLKLLQLDDFIVTAPDDYKKIKNLVCDWENVHHLLWVQILISKEFLETSINKTT